MGVCCAVKSLTINAFPYIITKANRCGEIRFQSCSRYTLLNAWKF